MYLLHKPKQNQHREEEQGQSGSPQAVVLFIHCFGESFQVWEISSEEMLPSFELMKLHGARLVVL